MGVSYVGQRAAILSGIGPLTYNACRFTVSSVLLLIFRPCLQHLLSTSEDNDNDNNEQTCDHNQYSDESSPLVLAVGKDTKPYTKPIINTTKVSSTIYSDSIQSNHTTTDTYNVKTCINVKIITTNHQTSDNSFQDTYNNDYKYNTQPSTSIMKKNTRTWYNLLLFGSALGITNFLGSALFQIALVSFSVTTAGFITSL